MKRLLLLFPLFLSLLLASCSTKKKYNSFREAVDACKEWADKGEFYIVKTTEATVSTYDGYSETFPSVKYEVPLRSCEEEMQTKQVLGLEIVNRKAKAIYVSSSYTSRSFGRSGGYGKGLYDDKTEVKKNFYF